MIKHQQWSRHSTKNGDVMCFFVVLEVKTECVFVYIGSFSVSHNRKIKNRKKSVSDKKNWYVLTYGIYYVQHVN